MKDDLYKMKADIAQFKANHEIRITHLEQTVGEIKDALASMSENIERAVNKWEEVLQPVTKYIDKTKTQKALIITIFSFVAGAFSFVWLLLQIGSWVFTRIKGF